MVLIIKSEEESQKSHDAFVRGPQTGSNWAAWEFKTLHGAAVLKRAVQDDVRRGKKQAPTIVLYIAQDIAPLGGAASINRGVRAALRNDRQRQAQAIVLLSGDGRMQILSREDFNNGRQFSDFQGSD